MRQEEEEKYVTLRKKRNEAKQLSALFQKFLLTNNHYYHDKLLLTPPASELSTRSEQHNQKSYLNNALDQAVLCGYNAVGTTNHQLYGEPKNCTTTASKNDDESLASSCVPPSPSPMVLFKKLLAPSAATDRLAEIAYRVALAGSDHSDGSMANEIWNHWRSVPAFLVALSSSMEKDQMHQQAVADPYEALPFQPPRTARALEAYGWTAAGVQNALLSLRSHPDICAQRVAPTTTTTAATMTMAADTDESDESADAAIARNASVVVQTPAFRELVDISPTDHVVVALIAVSVEKQ